MQGLILYVVVKVLFPLDLYQLNHVRGSIFALYSYTNGRFELQLTSVSEAENNYIFQNGQFTACKWTQILCCSIWKVRYKDAKWVKGWESIDYGTSCAF